MISDHAHCMHLWQHTKLGTDRQTCESPKFRATQTEKGGWGGEYPESKSALESKQDPPPACLHLHRYRLTHASENSSAGKRAKSRPPARIKGLATGPQALQGEVPGSAPGGHGEEIGLGVPLTWRVAPAASGTCCSARLSLFPLLQAGGGSPGC